MSKSSKLKNINELQVSFKVNFIPKSEASTKEMKENLIKDDIFAIQEIEIGKEDFVAVMGRTVIVTKEQ